MENDMQSSKIQLGSYCDNLSEIYKYQDDFLALFEIYSKNACFFSRKIKLKFNQFWKNNFWGFCLNKCVGLLKDINELDILKNGRE